MNEENWVHLHNGILLSHKNETMKCTGKWMELEKKIPSEITQTWKDKYSICLYVDIRC